MEEYYNTINNLIPMEENPHNKQIQTQIYQLLLTKNRNEATELIVQEFMKNNYLKVTRDDHNPEFYIYKQGIYKPEGKTYIEEYCRLILDKAYTTQILNEVCIKLSADNKVEPDEFLNTNYTYEIPVNNGILNIKKQELKPFTPDKYFFNKLPITYNQESKCPNILKFLQSITKTEDDVKLILEIIGFTLVKDYFMEVAIMLIGDGRNGKGKLLELIRRFVGLENTCSVRLQEMNTQSSSIHELHNRLVNLAGDLNNTALKETGLFKEITGRDSIQAKRKYKRDLTFVNYAKCVFACNELPKVYDNSKGFWSRWVLIEFPYEYIDEKHYKQLSIEERKNKKIKDPNIIDNIINDEELSGLLNLALNGLNDILNNKSFTYTANADEVKKMWQRKADSFVAFCIDHIEEDVENRIYKQDLKKHFNAYRKKHKLKSVSDKSIKVTLEMNYGITEGQDYETGQRYWEGIKYLPLNEYEKNEKTLKITKNNQNNINNIVFPQSLGKNSIQLSRNHVIPVILMNCYICKNPESHFYNQKGRPICKDCAEDYNEEINEV